MSAESRPIRLLMAEDDREDQMFVRKAFERSHLVNVLDIVEDGEQLLDFLRRRGRYEGARRPDLLLLDLNMPKKDGREALQEMKADPELRRIPVVVMTSSAAEEDVIRSYDLGISSYIQKPVTFRKLVEVIEVLGKYWFEIVTLPASGG
jgi:CheY-like chemotaxis protein